MNHKLRPYQIKAENDLRKAYVKHKAPILVMPTGSGKTHIFTDVANRARQKGHRSLIVVHRSYLYNQVSQKLNDIGVDHGIIAPGHSMTEDRIQIASIDTVIRRLDQIKSPFLIIYDECHHVIKNNKWGKLAQYFYNAKILGVTATPCRTSGQGLGINSGGFFDVIVNGPSILNLTPEYISPIKMYAPDIGIDMTGVRRIAGDYDRKETIKRVDLKSIYGNIPAHYKKICYGIPAIAFCVTVKHAEHVSEEFRSWGIPSASVSSKTPESKREELFQGLARGKYLVLCSCDLVSEGFDVPVCGCAILLRPTQSLILYLQQCGRSTRIAPGKKYAYIIDHVGNYIRHGFPDENREWSLDGIAYRKKTNNETNINIRTCPNCFHVHKPSPKCPLCGHVYVNGQKLPSVKEDAKLKEIETARKLKEEQIIKRKREQSSCNTLEALREYARKKGYKPGYVKHVWDSRMKKFNSAKNISELYRYAKLIGFPYSDVPREWERRKYSESKI